MAFPGMSTASLGPSDSITEEFLPRRARTMSIDSIVDVWHGFGAIKGYATHDGDSGNATSTSIEIDFCESQKPTVEIEEDEYGATQRITISINGGCEREGLGRMFMGLGSELLKREGELGESISIGYEDGKGSEKSLAQQKGDAGEHALNEWFNAIGISYLYINQSPETFSKLFSTNLKRPDFLVLLESIGLIAVDAKNYQIHYNEKSKKFEYSLPYETELKRVMTFERLFRIPVWYAYMSQESGAHGQVWHWISALKALEVGQIKTNNTTQEDFLVIELSHFEQIEKNEDLGKLYTHRLPALKKLRRS